MNPELVEVIRSLIESDAQIARDVADDEKCEWHRSRLRKAMMSLMRLFPKEALVALGGAKCPDGSDLWAD